MLCEFKYIKHINYFYLCNRRKILFVQTKTVQIKANETAQEIVNRCKGLFNLENNIENNYQLWLKTGKNEPLIPLIGK
jgi:hypothetical protein